MTHTYAILDVSPEAYQEIRAKMEAVGYQHAFHKPGPFQPGCDRPGVEVIDMHGIALRAEEDVFPNDEHGRRWLRNSSAYREGCEDCVVHPQSVTLCSDHASLGARSHPCVGCGARIFYADRGAMVRANAVASLLCPACEIKLPPAYAAWLATQENDGA